MHADRTREPRELRKARSQFGLLLEKAKDTLKALNIEMHDEVAERRSPLALAPRAGGAVEIQ